MLRAEGRNTRPIAIGLTLVLLSAGVVAYEAATHSGESRSSTVGLTAANSGPIDDDEDQADDEGDEDADDPGDDQDDADPRSQTQLRANAKIEPCHCFPLPRCRQAGSWRPDAELRMKVNARTTTG